MDDKIKKLEERVALAHLGGGEQRIAKQHAKKKLTARERIDFFLDEGSFEENGCTGNPPYHGFWNGERDLLWRWCNYRLRNG